MFGIANYVFILIGLFLIIGSLWDYKVFNPLIWGDTRNKKGVFKKIKEETLELEDAINSENKESIKEEIGDLLMIVTNLAQKLDIDSEEALRDSNKKFIKRFSFIEKKLMESKKNIQDTDLSILDELWNESKKLG